MEISVKRIGGFAGLSEDIAAVNTAALPGAVAQQVEHMVGEIRFFDLPVVVSGGTIGADLFNYEIRITENDRHHTVVVVDDDSRETAPLRRLVEALTRIGQ